MAIATALCPSVPIEDVDIPDLRDPDEAKIIATAISANAEVLITGDQDLLVLQDVQGIRILTPTQVLDLLQWQLCESKGSRTVLKAGEAP